MPHSTERNRSTETLIKTDHPRWIDRYIDFFGGAGLSPAGAEECVEHLARAASSL